MKKYSVIFVFLSFLFLLMQLFGPDLTINTIADKFLMKLTLIKEFNSFRYFIGDKIFNSGIVGEDNWLFYSGDFSIHDYQKTAPVGRKDLRELQEILVTIKEASEKNNGTFFVIIPPDKNTIYPQYMPQEISVIGETSRLDQFISYMQGQTTVQIVDLRPILMSASQETQVYFKSDAHWNCFGAYYATNELISDISSFYPALQPHSIADYKINTVIDSSLDISNTMGLRFSEETWILTPKFPVDIEVVSLPLKLDKYMRVAFNSQSNLPTALVLHDSFYNECFNELVEPYFSKTFSMHYGTSTLANYLELIEKEKPDVVIVEFAERHIEYFLRLLTSSN